MRGSTLIVFASMQKPLLNILEYHKVVSRSPQNYVASIVPQSL